ncbi:cell growth regulator with EF hand domain protein 1 isoform X2 [Bufo bufo]|uniref:cell growth regulator with EF hand domain protein 1 isoform X2 n=1 Tax=Bufo bufo TaxID=8384 RepID=UPI001ABDF35C|nr:cell growth regulator with EF hand domain protein 1 isoform X2 [Bufo bufo]
MDSTMRGLVLVRLLPLLFSHGLAAPRTESRSRQSDNINMSNPFTPGEEHLSILHGYLQDKDPLGENDTNMSRETAILRLFVLHDYDKSGLLDGLELMQLLHGVLTRGLQEKPTEDSVISVVDDVLERQDVNLDGLLSAQELVNSPIYKKKEISDPAHIVIPPPMGVPAEEHSAPVDSDLANKEETEEPEQPEEVHDVPPGQTNDPAAPPAEVMSSQEEADEIHNEDVVEEVASVEVVEMAGVDKADDEM